MNLYDQVQQIDERLSDTESVANIFPLEQEAIDSIWTALNGNKFTYGTATLSAGSVTVVDNNVTTNSVGLVTTIINSGWAYGVTFTQNGFTITSNSIGDGSTVSYLIIY